MKLTDAIELHRSRQKSLPRGGSTATRSLELAEEIVKLTKASGKRRAEGESSESGRQVQVILHLTCTNMDRELVDEALRKCKELGIRNILALRGDPPRKEEYRPAPGPDEEFKKVSMDHASTSAKHGLETNSPSEATSGEEEFVYAEDLVRYIRRQHGDYFCIGVAGYPTPHVDSPSPQADIQYLAQKVQAGADFIITQLFYDVDGFERWVESVREAGVSIPVIPGIMPIQNYASFRRLTNLCKCPVPVEIINELEPIKTDDAAVKKFGIGLATKMVKRIMQAGQSRPDFNVPGVHFCTLNLEKSVRTVLEDLEWTTTAAIAAAHRNLMIETDEEMARYAPSPPSKGIQDLSISPKEASFLAEFGNKRLGHVQNGDGSVRTQSLPGSAAASVTAAEETWDEYPNGRFTDVRSPAYGEIDGWGNGLKITPAQALRDWGTPVDAQSLSDLFCAYLLTDPAHPTTPFCDLPISPESKLILNHLLKLNSADRQCWTVGSQPAIDGCKSDDPIHGFGPKGGYVFQKAFVEFFVSSENEAKALLERVEKEGQGQITMYAGSKDGAYLSNAKDSVNTVTWACFPGQEIVQSTIIESVSFLAWKEEAFEIWTEWSKLFPLKSQSRTLLQGIASDSWLVSLIHHDYKDTEALWRFLKV